MTAHPSILPKIKDAHWPLIFDACGRPVYAVSRARYIDLAPDLRVCLASGSRICVGDASAMWHAGYSLERMAADLATDVRDAAVVWVCVRDPDEGYLVPYACLPAPEPAEEDTLLLRDLSTQGLRMYRLCRAAQVEEGAMRGVQAGRWGLTDSERAAIVPLIQKAGR